MGQLTHLSYLTPEADGQRRGLSGSMGLVAFEGDSVHDPAIAVIVVDRVVLGAAVVPKGDCIGLPLEATGELRLDLVLKKIIQNGCAFLVQHALDARGVSRVQRQGFPTGFRVGPHYGMLCSELPRNDILSILLDSVLPGF